MIKKFFTKNKHNDCNQEGKAGCDSPKINFDMFKPSKKITQVSVNLQEFCLAEFSIIDDVYNQLQLSTVSGQVTGINLIAFDITNETVKIYSSAILQCIGTPAVLIIDSEDKTLTLHNVN